MAFAVTKVGLLGESLDKAIGIHTVYTVTSGSTAMVKLAWAHDAGSSRIDVWIGSMQVFQSLISLDSLTGVVQSSGSGGKVNKEYDVSNPKVLEGSGLTAPTSCMVLPLDIEYGLISEETVRYEIAAASATSLVFRVQGKEFST